MSKAEVITGKHVSVVLKKQTLEQVELRLDLLKEMKENGVPEGFTAHLGQGSFLAYKNNELGIEKISRNAADDAKDGKGLKEIEKERAKLLKAEEKRKLKILAEEQRSELDSQSGPETKTALKQALKEMDKRREALAGELVVQRAAYNELLKYAKQHLPKNNKMLELISKHHQEKLTTLQEVSEVPVTECKEQGTVVAFKNEK